LDGATFSVAVPEDTRVAEMKRAIGTLREVPHYAMELFVEGEEEPLDDEKRLISAEKVPLFMLPKAASGRLAPSELQQLSALQVLILYNNKLTGTIPAELGQLEALTRLDLSGNQLRRSAASVSARVRAHNLIICTEQLQHASQEPPNPECKARSFELLGSLVRGACVVYS
jgi:Leucine-rich repeat (LRR) protein